MQLEMGRVLQEGGSRESSKLRQQNAEMEHVLRVNAQKEKKELVAVQKERDGLHNRLKNEQNAMKKIKSKYNALKKKHRRIVEQVGALKKELGEKEIELKDVKVENETNERSQGTEDSRTSEADNIDVDFENVIERVLTELAQTKTDVDIKEKECQRLNQQIDGLRKKLMEQENAKKSPQKTQVSVDPHNGEQSEKNQNIECHLEQEMNRLQKRIDNAQNALKLKEERHQEMVDLLEDMALETLESERMDCAFDWLELEKAKLNEMKQDWNVWHDQHREMAHILKETQMESARVHRSFAHALRRESELQRTHEMDGQGIKGQEAQNSTADEMEAERLQEDAMRLSIEAKRSELHNTKYIVGITKQKLLDDARKLTEKITPEIRGMGLLDDEEILPRYSQVN